MKFTKNQKLDINFKYTKDAIKPIRISISVHKYYGGGG